MSETALKHVEHFTNTIGPRGSATPEEKKAHEYAKSVLEGLGYEPQWEEYYSATSGWLPYTIVLGVMLLADVIFAWTSGMQNAQMGGLAASLLAVFAVGSFFLHLAKRDNPVLWFVPVAKSQNVWAVAKPTGEVRRRIVVSGHVDTHRVALAMQSPTLWQVFQILTTVSAIVNIALTGLFIYGIFSPDPLLRQIALYLGIVLVIGLVFTIHPETQPYVKGGNDNATGAGTVLALAEKLKAEPLANTEVYLVNTGCEEVNHYGMADWIKRHATEVPDAFYLVLDNIGGKGSVVNYVVDEAILFPQKSDGALINMAEAVAKEQPDLGATPFHYRGLDSELSTAARYGQKALGLLNFDPETKMPPLFHTLKDDFSNVDPEVLDKSERFVWGIMKKVDGL